MKEYLQDFNFEDLVDKMNNDIKTNNNNGFLETYQEIKKAYNETCDEFFTVPDKKFYDEIWIETNNAQEELIEHVNEAFVLIRKRLMMYEKIQIMPLIFESFFQRISSIK